MRLLQNKRPPTSTTQSHSHHNDQVPSRSARLVLALVACAAVVIFGFKMELGQAREIAHYATAATELVVNRKTAVAGSLRMPKVTSTMTTMTVATDESITTEEPYAETAVPTNTPTTGSPTASPTVKATRLKKVPNKKTTVSPCFHGDHNISIDYLYQRLMLRRDWQKHMENDQDLTPPDACADVHKCLIRESLKTEDNIADLTSCPLSNRWLDEYMMQHRQYGTSSSSEDDDTQTPSNNDFVALVFGCNKGYDAMHIANVISRQQEVFGKQKWTDALQLGEVGMCNQGLGDDDDDLEEDATTTTTRPVQVHCVEAMPNTAKLLQRAASNTTANQHGFHVYNYAVSGTPGGGQIWFPDLPTSGWEGSSMADCVRTGGVGCANVTTITIDEYVQQHVNFSTSSSNNEHNQPPRIPYLSIDIEGYDYTALQAAPETLARTDYLEFEYHNNGDWGTQHLNDAIDMLARAGFVCYWAGVNQLWRITHCWMDHFDCHRWSNVACVAPQYVPKLAKTMEQVFLETLLEEPMSK